MPAVSSNGFFLQSAGLNFNPNSTTIVEASFTAWLATGTPKDRLLQDDLFDVVRSEAAFNQRCANVQAKLIPLPERRHSANDQDSPRALVEVRPGPDLAPGIARDQVLNRC